MAVDSVLASLPTIASGAMLLREIEPDAALELAERHARPVPLALLRDAYLPGSDRASADAVEPFATHQLPPWGIALADGRLIGVCAFLAWSLRHARAPLVVTLEPGEEDGYLAGVVRTMIDFGFRIMELNRIEAPLGRDDVGPREAVASIGMRHEGTLRRELWSDGSFFDVELYATLREEWLRGR